MTSNHKANVTPQFRVLSDGQIEEIVSAALSGANLIHDVGYLESGFFRSLDILEHHQPAPLPEGVEASLRAIVAEVEARHAGDRR